MTPRNALAVTDESQTQPQTRHIRTGAPKTFGRLPSLLRLRSGTPAAVALAAECCLIAALGHPWIPTHQILTAPITFLAALLFFSRKQLQATSADVAPTPHRAHIGIFLALHAAAVVSLVTLQVAMLRTYTHSHTTSPLALAAWLVLLLVMAASLLAAIIPPKALVTLARRLGSAWAYATVCAFLAVFFRAAEYLAWDAPTSWAGNHLAAAAFSGVRALLSLFYPHIVALPETRILGTPTFLIHVAGACSGVEGLGLTLVLTLGWIVYERRSLRLARALWLVPSALAVMWILNLVRLTALIAIGNAGYPRLALTGFHTEAGWIAFTLVAIGFLLAASHLSFFRAENFPASYTFPAAITSTTSFSPTIYLLPFVAILATSLFTRAASTGFESFYAARLVIALGVLWAFRKRYAGITWSFGALDIAAGATVGLLWLIVASHAAAANSPAGATIATGLATLHTSTRTFWLTTRTLAAVITVPLAEELAFRGFLARRIIREDFAVVPYAALTLTSILLSSFAFGAMHGALWLPGTLSGVAFAALARRRNSLGAAIAAHSAANLVLALAALTHGNYGLW